MNVSTTKKTRMWQDKRHLTTAQEQVATHFFVSAD